jgi:hypothetical protein
MIVAVQFDTVNNYGSNLTINCVDSVGWVKSIMGRLAGCEVRNVGHLRDVIRTRAGRKKKFELVKMRVAKKLSDYRVSETVHESVVFASPTI